MLLYHTTTKNVLASIRKRGLLTAKSQGKRAAVWLHRRDKSAWAALHVICKRQCGPDSLVVVEVSVPDSWLRRSREGLYYTMQDIPPVRIRRVFVLSETCS